MKTNLPEVVVRFSLPDKSADKIAALRQFLDNSMDPDVIAGLAMALLDHIEEFPGCAEAMDICPPKNSREDYFRISDLPPGFANLFFGDRSRIVHFEPPEPDRGLGGTG